MDYILAMWIKEQKVYFNGRIEEINKKIKNSQIISWSLLIIGFLLLFVIYNLNGDVLKNILFTVDTLIFVIAYMFKEYQEQTGYKDLLWQYNIMFDIYVKVENELKKISGSNLIEGEKIKMRNEILSVLGKKALIENSVWYLLYQNRELKLKAEIG